MRVFILALSVFAILVGANVAKAGPSMTDRGQLASADSADVVQESSQETEDQEDGHGRLLAGNGLI